MFDEGSVALADLLAGGPRDDLDDVVLTGPPCEIVAVPRPRRGETLLDALERIAVSTERAWMVEKFIEDAEFNTMMGDRNNGKHAIARMFTRYGTWLYRRNPHLRKTDCYAAMVEMGAPNGMNALYKQMAAEGLSNTERCRVPPNKGVTREGTIKWFRQHNPGKSKAWCEDQARAFRAERKAAA